MRKVVTTVYRELGPQPFGEWLQERDEARQRARAARDRFDERAQAQGQERAQARHERAEESFLDAELARKRQGRQIER